MRSYSDGQPAPSIARGQKQVSTAAHELRDAFHHDRRIVNKGGRSLTSLGCCWQSN